MNEFIEKLVSIVPSEKQIKWQELEFTSFFHFGINTFTDREWGDGKEDISIFNPQKLNTDQWCESILKASIKACLITAKHHDGFCLWDTKYTNHSVMNTPFKRDIVKDLSISCKKYGIKLGIYLSPWDRHEPSYGTGKEYDDYFCNQLTELLTNYGDIYAVWFDGACGEGPNGKRQEYDFDRYYELIHKLQPDAVISICGPDVRWCGNEAGICRESEWSVVPYRLTDNEKIKEDSQKSDDEEFRQRPIKSTDNDLGSRKALENETELIWYPAEVDTSIRPGWFYHKAEDLKVKPLDTLLNIYLNSVGGNSVLLLNIPPNTDGLISDYDIKRLTEIGEFIKSSFSNNLIEKASLSTNSNDGDNKLCNVLKDDDKYWKPIDFLDSYEINIEFDTPKNVKFIVLKEQIRLSQRVEEFEILSKTQAGLKQIYKGTTVGYKKICKLEENDQLKSIIIKFNSSRKSPTLKFIGIY